MTDDWRLRVGLHETGLVHALAERLGARDLEHELETSFADRVAVSSHGSELFCYANAREQLEAAQRLIDSIAQEKGWQVDFELRRWHADEEAWKDPDVPLPGTGPERDAEHAALIARERDDSQRQGFPDYEVRVQCATEEDCDQFAQRLQDEGLQVVRRSVFLIVGAADEDSAQQLAARLHDEAPSGSAIVAEGTVPAVRSGIPFNPFALFGGLGV